METSLAERGIVHPPPLPKLPLRDGNWSTAAIAVSGTTPSETSSKGWKPGPGDGVELEEEHLPKLPLRDGNL